MSETQDLLQATATRLFADHLNRTVHEAAERGAWPAALWDAVAEAGLDTALAPEAAGGSGLEPADAFAVLDAAGHAQAPLPLAETLAAGWLLGRAGLAVPAGPLSLAEGDLDAVRDGARWRLSGTARRVPWGRHVRAVAAVVKGPDGPLLACVPAASWSVAREGTNLAGEPRDDLAIEGTVAADAVAEGAVDAVRLAGAAVRSAQIAGAARFALDLAVAYANTRVQFGKPIGKFQAIQHGLAVVAEQAAAAQAAAGLAADGLAGNRPALIAAAKARAGEAAGQIAGIVHQVHGAIGFTAEYELHRATRRLWSWRDEFGGEAEWQRLLGRLAVGVGADDLWPFLTAA